MARAKGWWWMTRATWRGTRGVGCARLAVLEAAGRGPATCGRDGDCIPSKPSAFGRRLFWNCIDAGKTRPQLFYGFATLAS